MVDRWIKTVGCRASLNSLPRAALRWGRGRAKVLAAVCRGVVRRMVQLRAAGPSALVTAILVAECRSRVRCLGVAGALPLLRPQLFLTAFPWAECLAVQWRRRDGADRGRWVLLAECQLALL